MTEFLMLAFIFLVAGVAAVHESAQHRCDVAIAFWMAVRLLDHCIGCALRLSEQSWPKQVQPPPAERVGIGDLRGLSPSVPFPV